MKAALRGSGCRPRELLRNAEERAVAIRKLLKKLGQGQGRVARGIMDDAAKLASTIEHVARWGQSRTAEESVEVEFLLEVLIPLLEVEIDQIFAS